MLNEFVILERGLAAAGFSVTPRHADVQSPGRSDAIHVRLDRDGTPIEVGLLKADRVSSLWTFRSGNQNSFPYVQLKEPLLSVPGSRAWQDAFVDTWRQLSLADRRNKLREIATAYPVASSQSNAWPVSNLEARQEVLKKRKWLLQEVLSVVDRFLRASHDRVSFFTRLAELVLKAVDTGDAEFIEAARIALCGKKAKQGAKAILGASLYYDVARGEFSLDIANAKHVGPLSQALRGEDVSESTNSAICAFTNESRRLHAGSFPRPNLPTLGLVYLFAKNEDITAAHRYNRFAEATMPVGFDLMQRLAGALDEITAGYRRGQTWRKIPGEKPKQSDLLLSFVDQVPDAPLAGTIADDEDETDDGEAIDPRAAFLMRTERVIDAVKAKVGGDFRKTPVTLCVLRKVDTGNAKAILHRAFTIGDLYDAAVAWANGQSNLPDWFTMSVPTKNKAVAQRRPPHVAPLQLPRLTGSLFVCGGSERARREPVGVTAQDALTLFLNDSGADRVSRATLRLVLERQSELLSGSAHALRKDGGTEKLKHALKFKREDALRAVTLLGLLLAKLGRGENYMDDVAFKLGQLLAVLDTVHIGYCMDVRNGDVPPTLLGNSALATAQSDPIKALAVLSRRWRPYAAWAKRPSVYADAEKLTSGDDKKEQRRGMAIVTAVSRARRADELCRELHGRLPRSVDDPFRAELLLGYVAGIPPRKGSDQVASAQREEGQHG